MPCHDYGSQGTCYHSGNELTFSMAWQEAAPRVQLAGELSTARDILADQHALVTAALQALTRSQKTAAAATQVRRLLWHAGIPQDAQRCEA